MTRGWPRSARRALRDFVATIRGPVLLDTWLGWVVRGRDMLRVGNWSLVAQSQRISKRLAKAPFFQEVVALSTCLSALEWTTYRPGRWLRAPLVHVAGTAFGSHATFRRGIALLDRLPPVTARPERRLFITRGEQAGRNPANLFELVPELERRGFEQVRFEGLTVVEQSELVNSAAIVVAVHGAGMANLAFHEAPGQVKLLEITPSDHLNPCFAFMAEEAGWIISASPAVHATSREASDTRFLWRRSSTRSTASWGASARPGGPSI
jgi:hypothetical protein